MICVGSSYDWHAHSQKFILVKRWQAVIFYLRHIHDKAQLRGRNCWTRQYPHITRLNKTTKSFRSAQNDMLILAGYARPVIRHQRRAIGDQLQGKPRFARPGWPPDQGSPPINSDRGRMKGLAAAVPIYHPAIPARNQLGSNGQTDDKSGAQGLRTGIRVSRADVLGPDHTIMRFDNLF